MSIVWKLHTRDIHIRILVVIDIVVQCEKRGGGAMLETLQVAVSCTEMTARGRGSFHTSRQAIGS